MNIAESRENYLTSKVKIAFTSHWPHVLNQASGCINLYRTFKFAIMIGNSSLDTQQRCFCPDPSIELIHCGAHFPLFKAMLLSPGTRFIEPVAHHRRTNLIDHLALKRTLQHLLKCGCRMKSYASFHK